MKIEILLHHVSQDQRNPVGEPPYFGWMHGPSGGGSGDDKTKPKPKEPRPGEPGEDEKTREDEEKRKDQETPSSNTQRESNYVLRPEPWGGVLISTNTQRVYAADQQAFELLRRLSEGEELDALLAAFDIDHGSSDRLTELLRLAAENSELANS